MAVTASLAALTASVGLFQFLSEVKVKKIGKTRIEEVTFIRNFVFRTYTKIKDVWVVFDKRTKTFRPADFRELPVRTGITILIGMIFLYISYLMMLTITETLGILILLLFRITLLIVFFVFGLYNFFLGVIRISSLRTENSVELCKLLNHDSRLKKFIESEKAIFEITPNFLLWRGLVTSVEIVSTNKIETKPIEGMLVEITKMIEKIK
jgi:hypothetical protein